jgi:hypothetical protein
MQILHRAFLYLSKPRVPYVNGAGVKGRAEVVVNFVLPFVAALVVLIIAQFSLGAFDAELTGDAASHYVSGIFIADLIRGGLVHPIERLRDFAAHYPLVNIGAWPPGFYGVEAVWSFLAPFDQRMMVLGAIMAALVVATIYALLKPRLGLVPAVLGASLTTLSPLVLSQVTNLMLDIPVTLGCLTAAAAFAQFLRTGRALPVVLFAVIAASTLMVKGNAGCLALLPPIGIVATGRFDRLRSPWLWTSIPIVLILAGPWYLFTHKMSEQGYRGTPGTAWAVRSLESNLHVLAFAVGLGVLLAATAGILLVVRKGRLLDPLWGSLFALLASVVLFLAVVPVALDDRYVMPAVPPLCALAAFLTSRLPNRWMRNTAFVVLLLMLVPGTLAVPRRSAMGVREAVEAAMRQMPSNNRALLVVSDDVGETAAVSELTRLRHSSSEVFGVRGVRLLGGGGYNNSDYIARYKNASEVGVALQSYRIPLLLLRDPNRPGEWAHIKQVADLVDRDPSRYQLVWSGRGGKLYKLVDSYGQRGEDKLLTELSAPHALGGGKIVAP